MKYFVEKYFSNRQKKKKKKKKKIGGRSQIQKVWFPLARTPVVHLQE